MGKIKKTETQTTGNEETVNAAKHLFGAKTKEDAAKSVKKMITEALGGAMDGCGERPNIRITIWVETFEEYVARGDRNRWGDKEPSEVTEPFNSQKIGKSD